MFSDGVVELFESGVITGEAKTLHRGKIVASFVLGSKRTFDFLDNNPFVEFHPSDYVNDPFVIAQNDKMVAINSAIAVDLTGQVCADSMGRSIYSGFGGQVDFIRGASRSRGGRPIIALPSTAKDGTVSRIVDALAEGAGVVTSRADVHYVVTEHGTADLHGRSLRERAQALIACAHPDFRDELQLRGAEAQAALADGRSALVTLPAAIGRGLAVGLRLRGGPGSRVGSTGSTGDPPREPSGSAATRGRRPWPGCAFTTSPGGQVLVDRAGGLAAGAHGQDHGGGARDDVAAGEDALLRGAQRLRVGHGDVALLVRGEVGRRRLDERVGARADGDDRDVERDLELRALDRDRAAAARVVRLAERHADAARRRAASPCRRRGRPTGWVSVWISTPSSLAWWISSARPGISASERR